MNLGAFVQQPQVKPFVGGVVPVTQPQTVSAAVDNTKILVANLYPTGFKAGTTQHGVFVITDENYNSDSKHGDVNVFKRPSGTVGVKQFINGVWKTLFNEDEAKKKFGSAPPIPAPAPAPPVQAPAPQTNMVMGVMILGATTDNVLNGQSAENKSVGIVKREGGTVGVKQMLNGKWETLYTEAEAVKRFSGTDTVMFNQGVLCAGCTDVVVSFDEMVKGTDGYYYCCVECAEYAGADVI